MHSTAAIGLSGSIVQILCSGRHRGLKDCGQLSILALVLETSDSYRADWKEATEVEPSTISRGKRLYTEAKPSKEREM